MPYCLIVCLNVCLHRACVPLEVFFKGNIGLSSVAYADNVLLLARTRRGLLSNFTILTNELSKIGLSVNASKYEYFF